MKRELKKHSNSKAESKTKIKLTVKDEKTAIKHDLANQLLAITEVNNFKRFEVYLKCASQI